MKKWIVSIALSLVVLPLVAQIPTTDKERLAIIQHVDFGRIITTADTEIPVELTFGRRLFKGKLVLEGVYVTEAEVVRSVKEAWKEMDRDYQDQGGFGNYFLLEAAEYESRFDLGPVNWPFVLANLCQMAAAVPGPVGTTAGVAADAINLASGLSSMGEVYFSQSGQWGSTMLENTKPSGLFSAGGAHMAHTAGSILSSVNYVSGVIGAVQAGHTLYQYLERRGFLEPDDPLTKVLQNHMLIEDFYWRCNQKIYRIIQERGRGKQWALDIDSWDNDLNKTLFGCTAPQTWHVQMHLKRLVSYAKTKDVRDWQGQYQGDITVTIDHGMHYFDDEFKEKVILNGEALPFKDMQDSGLFVIKDEYTKGEDGSVLFKQLSGNRYTLDLRSEDGTRCGGMKSSLLIGGLTDKTQVIIKHKVLALPNVGPTKEGKVEVPHLVSGDAEFTVMFKQGTETNLRNVQVIVYEPLTTDVLNFLSTGVVWLGEQFLTDMEEMTPDNTIIMNDRSIFSDLRDRPRLKIGKIVAKTPFR